MNAIISDLTIRAGGGKKQSKGTKKNYGFLPIFAYTCKRTPPNIPFFSALNTKNQMY